MFAEDEEEVWENEEAEEELNQDFIIDSECNVEEPEIPSPSPQEEKGENCLVSWLVLFLMRLQSKYYIPDAAIGCLLKFMYAFLVIIGKQSVVIANIVKYFPQSIHCLRKYWDVNIEFERLVVCRKCYSVYDKKYCVEKRGTQVLSKFCKYRDHVSAKKSCDQLLLKTVRLLNGKACLYPFKVYCYQSLVSSIQGLLQRPGFPDLCEHWRARCGTNGDLLRDIYDGRIWNEFQSLEGRPFLKAPYTYALMLNLDWFQPYKLTQSLVGALYLTIMNLPYEQRFKRENIILLGIIPGPCEPPRDINQYLKPLVKELLELYSGIRMNVFNKEYKQVVRCALIGVPCDMPAGRKACGFLGHGASLGCTKCYKSFPGTVGNMDYSGFNMDQWELRTNSAHRNNIEDIKKAKTKTERNQLESHFGCRYSVLLQLTYFDPTRMLIIDPMHNLFLGTAKRMKNMWLNDDETLVTKSQLQVIQNRANNMHVPADIGRIPRKIETKFAGFTADQYKNWVNLYSIPCLYNILDEEHMECWRHFVLACRLLCKKVISKSDINLADILLLQFCRRVERLYGKEFITQNMHMHVHLKQVLLDYGPVYGFWLFSYERYNGILEHQPTNNRSIEIQLMSRFVRDNNAYAAQSPVDYRDELDDLCALRPRLTGSLLLASSAHDAETPDFIFPSSCTHHIFSESELAILKQLMIKLEIISSEENVALNSAFCKYKYVTRNGTKLLSSSSKHMSVLLATWNEDVFGQDFLPSSLQNPADANLRPVKVNYFLKLSYHAQSDTVHTHTFISVSWFLHHPSRFEFGKPVQLWCKNAFEPGGLHSFVPLNYVVSRCIHSSMHVDGEDCLVVIPLINN